VVVGVGVDVLRFFGAGVFKPKTGAESESKKCDSAHLWSLTESFGECFGNTMWEAACYWTSSDCIPAQKFVSVSATLNHKRSTWVWDSEKVVYLLKTVVYSISRP